MSANARARWAGSALALLLLAGAARAAEQPRAELTGLAVERLEALEGRRVEGLSPFDVLVRNLSRFFVTYPVASESDELAEVLGLAELFAGRHVWSVLQRAAAGVGPVGSGALTDERVAEAALRLLPRRATPWGETEFFPDHPAAERTVIEDWDLEAFGATGFGWQTLLSLAEPLARGTPPEVTPAAAERLAAEAEAAGLVLLRRAGQQAQRDRATALSDAHLRAEARHLEELIGRAAAGVDPRSAPEDSAAAPTAGPGRAIPGSPGEAGAPDPESTDAAPRPFTDVTEAAGVRFRHVSSDWLARWRRYGPLAPSFSGGGVAAGDLDGDGWPDLVLCGGQGCRAFRNRGDGGFEDVTTRFGLGAPCEARMPIVADFDNDGWQDLFVTCAREGEQLYRGLPGGGFEAAAAGSGLAGEGGISGPATAVDVDLDGRLDLYVGRFGNYLAGESPFSAGDNKNGLPDRLYRNRGALRFEDVSAAAGVGNTGWAQAVSHADVDGDGDQDLYVANDFGRNELLLNRGDGTFEAAGALTGSDDPSHGMNVAFADLNADRLPDLFITNIWRLERHRLELVETNTLLLSRAGGERPRFEPPAEAFLEGLDTGWSWAAQFLDFDNDADDDLFVVNGFTDYWTTTQMRAHPDRPGERYWINNGRESNYLLVNRTGLPGEPMASGAELADANSRALARLDYDLDGDVDLAITAFHGWARLFRNDHGSSHRWLAVDLVGSPAASSSRDAVGAVVEARLPDGGPAIWRQVSGGEGYMSMSSRTVAIGLAEAEAVELEVRWPGGGRQRFAELPADRRLRIVERPRPGGGRAGG